MGPNAMQISKMFPLVSVTGSIENQKKELSAIQRLYFKIDNGKRSDDSADISNLNLQSIHRNG